MKLKLCRVTMTHILQVTAKRKYTGGWESLYLGKYISSSYRVYLEHVKHRRHKELSYLKFARDTVHSAKTDTERVKLQVTAKRKARGGWVTYKCIWIIYLPGLLEDVKHHRTHDDES
ncbi:Uncharacterized protein Rs2_05074 [Raphanus sativus]|nr:Uncharacterized protein Rs2_05074 [Raphanus sativus]